VEYVKKHVFEYVWDVSLVPFLEVVANIQVQTLKTDVEKGFMITAVGHE